MIIKNSHFVIGAVSEKQYPTEGYPEIALCGRSNVGKSSLINKLIQRKNLARTSSQPGKTRQLNYYFIETDVTPFYFVDLPGYGFAKASREERGKWGSFIEHYLLNRREKVLTLQVVDIRHLPTKDDIAMYQWLLHHQIEAAVIATKADKISKGQYAKQLNGMRKHLGMSSDSDIYLVSSENGYGFESLNRFLTNILVNNKS